MKTSSGHGLTGLALGSGAARGLAQIGIFKVLDEAEIPIDIIAGTSIGAFIGAMYAAGVPVEQMEKVALEIDWRSLTKLLDPVLPISGLIDGKKLMAFMAELLPARNFEDLKQPLAVTATDINTGEAIVIKQGNLLAALRASLAFPGIFSPARFGQRFLVDGGLCNPIPADVARSLGAKHVIGVCTIPAVTKTSPETFLPSIKDDDQAVSRWRELISTRSVEHALSTALGQGGDEQKPEEISGHRAPNIFRVCAQSVAIMENQINDLRLRQNHHDLIIRPSLNDITLLEFHRAAEIIDAGEVAARAALPDIKSLLGLT